MSEQPQESGQEVKGTEGELPTPQFQEPSGAQQTSGGTDLAALTAALKDALLPELDERISRTVQSTKDRRLGKFDKRLEDVESVLAEFKQLTDAGVSPEQATDRVLLNRVVQLMDERAASATPQQEGGASAEAARQQARDILREAGIPENDPTVTELFSRQYSGATDFMSNVARFVATRSGRPANPGAVAPGGGGASAGSDQERLRQQYEAEKKRIRRGDIGGLHALQTRYRKQGLDI